MVVAIAGGLAYTWFMGRTPSPATVVDDSTDTSPTPALNHVEPASNVQQGASVQSLTSPVVPGDNASVTVKTNPGSWCTIGVKYDKTLSKDSGLIGKTADEFGVVSWTWTVESTVPLGKWPVTVTCLRNKLSAVVIGDLVVKQAID